MKRIGVFVIIAVGISALLLIAKLANRSGPAVAVRTIVVKRGHFETKLPENGVVERPRVATVPAMVSGNIGHIYVKAGETVVAGDMLATIVNPTLLSNAASSQADYEQALASIQTARINSANARVTYQADVETAKSNLDEARRVYDADVALFKNRAIARNQLDTDRAKLEQMRVTYDQALRQAKLGAVTGYSQDSIQVARATARKMAIVNAANQQQVAFTRVVAPISGVVESIASESGDPLITVRPGDAVTQGEALFTIAENDSFIVEAEVDEQDIINVHRGQRAVISGEDFPGKHISGVVTDISPVATKSADASSTAKQVLTTIRLERSPSYLRDGMNVDVDILTSDAANVLAVPTDAIVSQGGKSYVFVVRNGRIHKTAVVTGMANDTQTVIVSGLSAGERIVSKQTPGLLEGERVTLAPSPTPPASP